MTIERLMVLVQHKMNRPHKHEKKMNETLPTQSHKVGVKEEKRMFIKTILLKE